MMASIFSNGTFMFNLDCYVHVPKWYSKNMGPFMSKFPTYWFLTPMPVTSLVLQ